jgi:hypothetical protein
MLLQAWIIKNLICEWSQNLAWFFLRLVMFLVRKRLQKLDFPPHVSSVPCAQVAI